MDSHDRSLNIERCHREGPCARSVPGRPVTGGTWRGITGSRAEFRQVMGSQLREGWRDPPWQCASLSSDSNGDSNRTGRGRPGRGGDGRRSEVTATDGRRRTKRPELVSEIARCCLVRFRLWAPLRPGTIWSTRSMDRGMTATLPATSFIAVARRVSRVHDASRPGWRARRPPQGERDGVYGL